MYQCLLRCFQEWRLTSSTAQKKAGKKPAGKKPSDAVAEAPRIKSRIPLPKVYALSALSSAYSLRTATMTSRLSERRTSVIASL